MEYGINIRFFERLTDMETAAKMIRAAGFTKLDYTPALLSDTWCEKLAEDLKIFAKYGLTVHQTHAPFNRYGSYKDKHLECLWRCAEVTKVTGANYMVVHGDEFDFSNLTFTPEAALAYNHDLFLPFVEHAAKNGYKIAFETMFEDLDRRRFTSYADELMALIKSYNSDAVCCCWDFGHGYVSFKKDAPARIREFGSLIECTHLHDNIGTDAHHLPMTGKIDWQATMEAFRDIGYNGVMSVEYAYGSMPKVLMQEFLNLTFKTAKYLGELCE